MPLLKRKPFPLIEPPNDLSPDDQVWQIRFTHEIFRDYAAYLNRLNLFRQRVWTCKSTGKTHLTYEEALVSEQQANQKLRQFPEEFKAFVLQNVQYSMLKLNDLVAMIVEKLGDNFVEGEELLGHLQNTSGPCKIMKVLGHNGGTSYEVGWLNESREVINTSVANKVNLIRKSFPFSRGLLKIFIKESTFQNNPWVVYSNLAKTYGLPTKPPSELQDRLIKHQDADGVSTTKTVMANIQTDKAKGKTSKASQKEIEKIVYPIEDLLVKPSPDDPVFTERPVPSTIFLIPMDCVGDLLMIWDFFSSFSRILRLSPFSFTELEEAIAYDGVSNLIAEAHIALLSLLINEEGEFYSLIEQKERSETITVKSWLQYLCDFLELEGKPGLTSHMLKLKNGKYNGLTVHDKVEILRELLYQAVSAEAIKEEIDNCIEKRQALIASKREEDLEELRKRREEKRLKQTIIEPTSEPVHSHEQTYLPGDVETKDSLPIEDKHSGNSVSKLEALASRKALVKKNLDMKIALEKEKETAILKGLQRIREEGRARSQEAREKKLKQQRSELYEKEIEKLHIGTDTLGKDRDRNTYWFFRREWRIFVVSADHNKWGFYTKKEELDDLLSSLNPKGERELALKRHLEKHYQKIRFALQKRCKEMERQAGPEDTAVLRRSVRVSALPGDESKKPLFLQYVNNMKK